MDVLGREKLLRWVQETEIPDVMVWILSGSVLGPDPKRVDSLCRDPKDDYVIALAKKRNATIVTGDEDIQALKPDATVPIQTPRENLESS